MIECSEPWTRKVNANLYMIQDLNLDAKNGTSWKKQKKEKKYVWENVQRAAGKRMEYYSSLEKFKQGYIFA